MNRVEVRCGWCSRRYLIDPSQIDASVGSARCRDCGQSIDLKNCSQVHGHSEEGPTLADAPRALEMPETSAPTPKPGQVTCPKCGHHFASSDAKPRLQPSGRPTVLVVEDMPFFRDAAREALSGKYRVMLASTVEEARRMLSTAADGVDLMVLDLTLRDGQNGLEILRDLPEKPCPVIVFTAQDESDTYSGWWENLRSLGADDLVMKGMHVGESLLQKVDSLLGRADDDLEAL